MFPNKVGHDVVLVLIISELHYGSSRYEFMPSIKWEILENGLIWLHRHGYETDTMN